MNNLEVITFGETMVLFEPGEMYPIEYVNNFSKHIGGAESNVAIGLSKLGHKVGWFSKLGEDPFGRFILEQIRGKGIDTSKVTFANDKPTGLIFKEKKSSQNIKVYYYRANSAASTISPSDIDEAYLKNTKILHITGITAALSDSCEDAIFEAIRIAKKNNVQIVFDPNIRLKLWKEEKAKEVLNKIAEKADVILPGIEEGQLMTGKQTPEEISRAFNDDGKKLVIVKLGPKGAFYHSAEKEGYVKGFEVQQVIDPVGAGDAFAVGVLRGLLKSETLEKIALIGCAMGAIAVTFKGDIEGLPSEEELNTFLNDKNPKDIER